MSAEQRIRITLTRSEFLTVCDAIEQVIEDYKYDGGTALAEREIALSNKLYDWRIDFDVHGKRAVRTDLR